MIYKTLSVKQPYATLICAGVKTVENRSWKTDYRGRLLIHASGDSWSYPSINMLPESFQKRVLQCLEKEDWSNADNALLKYDHLMELALEFYGMEPGKEYSKEEWKEAVKKYGFFSTSQAIIGFCDLIDVVDDSKDDFAESGCYHWILGEAYLFDNPLKNVLGHLRLWDYEDDIDLYNQ